MEKSYVETKFSQTRFSAKVFRYGLETFIRTVVECNYLIELRELLTNELEQQISQNPSLKGRKINRKVTLDKTMARVERFIGLA